MNDTPENDNVIPLKPKIGPRKPVRNQALTIKQNLFAEGLAAGKHFVQAYRDAYNTSTMNERTVAVKARHEAKNNPKIVARVAELRAKVDQVVSAKLSGASVPGLNKLPKVVRDTATAEVKRVSDVLITRQTLTHMLLEDRKLARELGQASAAVASAKELGKLHQLTSDNRESAKMSEFDQMTPAQLKDYIRAEIAKSSTVIDLDGLIEFVDMRPPTDIPQ